MHAKGKNQISGNFSGKYPKVKQQTQKLQKGGDLMGYSSELEKLNLLFEKVDPSKQKLSERLLEEAAFLSDELNIQRDLIKKSGGMVKVHPTDPSRQKQTEVGKQYLKTLQAYSLVIKTLNGILAKNSVDDDDEFDQFEKEEYDE